MKEIVGLNLVLFVESPRSVSEKPDFAKFVIQAKSAAQTAKSG